MISLLWESHDSSSPKGADHLTAARHDEMQVHAQVQIDSRKASGQPSRHSSRRERPLDKKSWELEARGGEHGVGRIWILVVSKAWTYSVVTLADVYLLRELIAQLRIPSAHSHWTAHFFSSIYIPIFPPRSLLSGHALATDHWPHKRSK